MKRREFATLVGGAVVVPRPTLAQVKQRPALPHIGILVGNLTGGYDFTSGVRAKLADFALLEGKDFRVESRFAAGHDDRLAELAAELVKLPVAVIVTQGGPAIRAARQATMSIPIVMVTDVDPVADGLVQSFARPGGNLTGIALLSDELAAKRLELLRELVPGLRRLGLLMNPDDAGTQPELKTFAGAIGQSGLTSQILPVRRAADLEPALALALGSGCGAIMVLPDRTISALAPQIDSLAIAKRLPLMYPNRFYVGAFATSQGLMSYGPVPIEVGKRVASFVARILKGAKPADLPIEQPVAFELAINLQTVRALGLTVPGSLLARADVVVE
jgi:putative ABC transport system substrate-binding protein